MSEEEKKNTSLIIAMNTGLTKVSRSLQVTDKIIAQSHQNQLELEQAHSNNVIVEILKSDLAFFIQAISMNYPFIQNELDEFWDVLEKGDAFYSEFIHDVSKISSPQFGLCFNKNINWTLELKAKWSDGFYDPYSGKIQGNGGGQFKVDDKDKVESPIPMDSLKELKVRNECLLDYLCDVVLPYQDPNDLDNFEFPEEIDIEQYLKIIPKLNSEEFGALYASNRSQILLNTSIWKNTLNEIITKEIVSDLLAEAMNRR